MRKITALSLIISLLLTTFGGAYAAEFDEFIDRPLEINNVEDDTSPYCGNSEMLEQRTNALIQRKMAKVSEENGIVEEGIAPYSLFEEHHSVGLTPSTGDVRLLIVPIEFIDYKMPDGALDDLAERYFAEYDEKKPLSEQSLRGVYQRISHGKLNFSGDILPICSIPKSYTLFDGIGDNRFDENGRNAYVGETINQYFATEGVDYRDYDSDGDGYIDGIFFVYSCPTRGLLSGGVGPYIDKIDSEVGAKVSVLSEPDTLIHEMGHMLGLGDNYADPQFGDRCVLDGYFYDIMSCDGYFLNAFYMYLLEWIDPIVLPYEDKLQDIRLFSLESASSLTNNRAVIFAPDPKHLPFSEFYMVEYRSGTMGGGTPTPQNVIIWHCDAWIVYSKWLGGGTYINGTGYLKDVYKKEGSSKKYYKVGDVWSADTSPSSHFDYTYMTRVSAYMKVLAMEGDEAIIRAGYVDPGPLTEPIVTISLPSKKAVRSGEKVTYDITYENYTVLDIPDWGYINSEGEGDAQIYSWGDEYIPDVTNVKRVVLTAGEGEGRVGFYIPVKTALNGAMMAPIVHSEKFYIDNTPPEITVNDRAAIVLHPGEVLVDAAVEITDNLDPDIEKKLVVDTSAVDFHTPGTYAITYTATDHAGNEAQPVTREVIVAAPGDDLISEVQYSTTEQTGEDVVVTIVPSEEVAADTKLSHTFTKNGSHTFVLTDLAGNRYEKQVTVDWIDKEPPQIILNGEEEITLKHGETYVEQGAVVTDNWDENVSDSLVIDSSEVDSNHAGTYHVYYRARDCYGNQAEEVRTVRVALGVAVEYSTTDKTNEDVVVTLVPSDPVATESELTYTFTDNDLHTFRLVDMAGNVTEYPVTVDWIDKEPPRVVRNIFSRTTPGSGSVAAAIVLSETATDGKKWATQWTHLFTENGTRTFILTDAQGNTGVCELTVDWIDKLAPVITLKGDSEVTLKYGAAYVDPGVEVTDDADKNIADKLVIDTSEVDNTTPGNYNVYYNVTDWANRKAEQVVRKVTILEPTTPLTAEVTYSTKTLTNEDVTVTVTPSKEVVAGTALEHTFTENGTYTFRLEDLDGNTLDVEVNVTWIDKEPPTAEVVYSTTEQTSEEVVVTLTPSEAVTDDTVLTYTFTENGEHTFILTDLAGNSAEILVTVDWIVPEQPPVDPVVPDKPKKPSYGSIGFSRPSKDDKEDGNKEEEEQKPVPESKQQKPYIQGYEDKTFRPGAKMTRAEAAAIFARNLADYKEEAIPKGTAAFPDVKAGAWYSAAVAYLTQSGIITGYDDGLFHPDGEVTRAEFAVMCSRYHALTNGAIADSNNAGFVDVPANHWAGQAIAQAKERGWVIGYEDGSFQPGNSITRAEVVAMINRMTGREKNNSAISPFSDLQDRNFWAYGEIMAAVKF